MVEPISDEKLAQIEHQIAYQRLKPISCETAEALLARLRQAEAALATARNDALEEAAETAEAHGDLVSNEPTGKACSRNIARAIRAMKAT